MTVPTHPFRFTVQCHGPADPRGWRDQARRAEALGYSELTVPDHLDTGLGPIAALMAAADATTTIGLAALVFCNDHHHPAVLAKEAATLDVLTGGRLTLGLGAGWQTTDYERSGILLDSAGVRVDRLTEAVAVMKGLFADQPCTFHGAHYRITDLDGHPKPLQRPHPRLLIGGGGRRVLSLAAREADVVGLNIDLRSGRIDETAGPTATADATDTKVAWIREAAEERFAQLELQVRIHLAMVTDDRDGVAEAVGPAFGLTPEQAKASPHALVGTIDELADQCEYRRARWGISVIGVADDAMDSMAPLVERLAGR